MLGYKYSETARKGGRDGLEWGAGGRWCSTEKGISDVCATSCCAPTMNCVMSVMIKHDATFQMQLLSVVQVAWFLADSHMSCHDITKGRNVIK